MKGYSRWLVDTASIYLHPIMAAASAGIRGFSVARTSVKFLIGILAISIPIAIVVLQPPSKASALPIMVNTTSDTPAMGFLVRCEKRIGNANSKSDVSGGHFRTAGAPGSTPSISALVAPSSLGSPLPSITNTAGNSPEHRCNRGNHQESTVVVLGTSFLLAVFGMPHFSYVLLCTAPGWSRAACRHGYVAWRWSASAP